MESKGGIGIDSGDEEEGAWVALVKRPLWPGGAGRDQGMGKEIETGREREGVGVVRGGGRWWGRGK
jgi:hypothetical protein